jgi:phosphoglycerate kinase
VLENLRFHPEEEANDAQFAKQLAALADVFVQDGFAVVHRAHASTEAVTHFLPSIAGLLLEREVDTITSVMENPERPLMAVVGGAKISDKIEVLHRFIEIADVVVVGGAMANTFLAAQGVDVAMSLVERDAINVAQEVIVSAKKRAKEGHFIFALPVDGVVATEISVTATTRIVGWKEHSIAAIENYPKQPPQRAMQLESGERILDIGPCSASFFAGLMQLVNTVVWNGTMGVTETKGLGGSPGPFARGTELIVEAMLGNLGHRPFSVVGGGDTVGYIEQRQLAGSFDHVSTGGGASLELMSGRKLPGVEALEDR